MKIDNNKDKQIRTTLHNGNNGFVLISVVLIIVMLTAILLQFNYNSRMDVSVIDNFQIQQQAMCYARGGLNVVLDAIVDNPDAASNDALYKLITKQPEINIGTGHCVIRVADESGKLNINMLKKASGSLDRSRIDQLLAIIDIVNQDMPAGGEVPYGIVPAIIDWTDLDDDVTLLEFVRNDNLGAESNYYKKLRPSYQCANAPLDSINDIILLKGIASRQASEQHGLIETLENYITTFGQGKININTAPVAIIASLSGQISIALAEAIVAARVEKPFQSRHDLLLVGQMSDEKYDAIKDSITFSTEENVYTVTALGYAGNLQAAVNAIVKINTDTNSLEIIYYREL